MDELLAQLNQTINDHNDWIGHHAVRIRDIVNLYQTNMLPKAAAVHNLETITKNKPTDVPLNEFEEKLKLDSLVSQIVEVISHA